MLRLNLPWAVLLAALCAGCGARPAAEAVPPSPTIAAIAPRPTAEPPTPAPSEAAAPQTATAPPSPSATSTPAAAATTTAPAETPFAYLWPEYVPDGMAPASAESRIARDGELGPGDIGFFVVTFNGGGRKLVVGGGAAEPFPITGRITTLALGDRGARLVTSDDQRQLVISGTQGALFVYGAGIAEEELVRVAESLHPIDVAELRRRVAGAP